MGFHFKDKNEIKTFILYLLTQIDRPVDVATLNDIVVQDDFVNQFDFMDAFFELCESGAVTKQTLGDDEVFSVSQKGRSAVELLEGDLIGQIKERAARSAMRLLSFRRTGAKATSKITQRGDGASLELLITDGLGKRFDLTLNIDSARRAEAIKRNFDDNPEFVYRAVLGVLSGDINYLSDAWLSDVDSANDAAAKQS